MYTYMYHQDASVLCMDCNRCYHVLMYYSTIETHAQNITIFKSKFVFWSSTDPIQITLPARIDISQYTVGEFLTIDCLITTCAKNVTLIMSPSIAKQSIIIYSNALQKSVRSFVVRIGPTIAGNYTFTAGGIFFDGSTYSMYSVAQSLSITGKARMLPNSLY